MTLQASGTITLAQIAAEFGGSTPHSLSEYYRGGGLVPNTGTNSAIPTSGTISFSNFYSAAALPPPITVNADWGSSPSVPEPSTTSPSRTLTVPSGNPGTIRFNTSWSGSANEYRKNGGSYISVTDGLTVSVANGDTIQFRLTGSNGDYVGTTVTDHTTSDVIGAWDAALAG